MTAGVSYLKANSCQDAVNFSSDRLPQSLENEVMMICLEELVSFSCPNGVLNDDRFSSPEISRFHIDWPFFLICFRIQNHIFRVTLYFKFR